MLKTFYRIFTIADYEEEEAWLREQHKKGWKLVRMVPPCFFTFASCEPEDVIYRLDYKNSSQSAEYMQMLKDFGWEYIGDCLGWLYFRKPAQAAETEEDGELFSETASRVEMVSRIVRTRLVPLGIISCAAWSPTCSAPAAKDGPPSASSSSPCLCCTSTCSFTAASSSKGSAAAMSNNN